MIWLVAVTTVAADPKTLEPKEFIALMEKSPHHYKVSGADQAPAQWAQQNAMRTWPRAHEPIGTLRRVKREGGGWDVAPCVHDAEAQKMLDVAEPLFESHQYAAAEAEYAKILKRFPDDYEVHLHYGDTALLDRRPKEALARYEAAAKLNPHDFHSWWYRGDALAALGRGKDALPMWLHALALRPTHAELLNDLEVNLPHLGMKLRAPVFLPQARVELDGDTTTLVVQPGGAWLAWAMCKAVWLSEPDFREKQTGRREHTFTMLEERQCLVNFAAAYAIRDPKRDPEDAAGEHVLAVAKAKMLDGLIAYEIAPRVAPDVMATSDDAGRAALELYIRKFVLSPPQ